MIAGSWAAYRGAKLSNNTRASSYVLAYLMLCSLHLQYSTSPNVMSNCYLLLTAKVLSKKLLNKLHWLAFKKAGFSFNCSQFVSYVMELEHGVIIQITPPFLWGQRRHEAKKLLLVVKELKVKLYSLISSSKNIVPTHSSSYWFRVNRGNVFLFFTGST